MEPQQAFDRLVGQDFQQALSEDLKAVALAVWYEAFIPDVTELGPCSARAACYLLDSLMRFNVVSIERKKSLFEVIELLSFKFNLDNKIITSRDRRVDRSARRWGLQSDLRLMLREILPYQSRHYRHHQVKKSTAS